MGTFIGVGMGLVGGFVQSCGFIIQKKGHNAVNEFNAIQPSKETHISILQNKVWYIGISIYAVGGVTNAASLTFAPQSVIASLGAINLASNAVMSYFFLKEPLKKKDIASIVIIIVGILLVVLFGPKTESFDLTIDELRALYEKVPYIAFSSTLTFLVAVDLIGVKFVEWKNKYHENSKENEIAFGGNFLMISYTVISAYFGAMNTVFIKSLVTIISSSTQSADNLNENVTSFLSYFIVVLWVFCLFAMEFYRQRALSYFGALYVIPIFAVFAITLTSVLGAIYFEELGNLQVYEMALFVLGLVVTVSGVVVLTYDFGKLLAELDEMVKVAFLNNDADGDDEANESKYPECMVFGGVSSDALQYYYFRKKPFCYNSNSAKKNAAKLAKVNEM